MEKRISYSQFQSVKSVAKACNPLIMQRDKVMGKILKLKEEYEGYNEQISALEQGIKKIIGFSVEELVKKVIETDTKGNKVTKYLPTAIVSYDEQRKEYVISVPKDNDGGVPMEAGASAQPAEAPETVAETSSDEDSNSAIDPTFD